MSDRDDYKVGYKKPPKHTQFQPGESGNPKGKTKGSKNARTILKKLMDEKIKISINGDRQAVSKLEGMLMQLANKALQGDLKAQHKVLHMLDENEVAEGAKELADFSSAADDTIIANLMERLNNDDSEN